MSAKRAPSPAEIDIVESTAPLPAGPPPARRGTAVVALLDADQPFAALRGFLDDNPGELTTEQAAIALGSAQLMLAAFAREQRSAEVAALLDLVIAEWPRFPDRIGLHAQALLRSAFAAAGGDRERVARLVALVPLAASAELRFDVACALALAGERDAMLRAIEAALAAGAAPAELRRDPAFAAFSDDPGFTALFDRVSAEALAGD